MAAIVNKVYTQDKLETMFMHLFGLGGGGGGRDGQTMHVMGIAKVVNNIKQANKQTNKKAPKQQQRQTKDYDKLAHLVWISQTRLSSDAF